MSVSLESWVLSLILLINILIKATSMIGEGVQIAGDIFIKKSEEIPFTLPGILDIRPRNSSGMPLPTNLFVSLFLLALHTGMTIQQINIIGRISLPISIKT